jgi:hypothetical protein
MQEILKVLKKNPNCFIYYNDNGSWSIYASEKEFRKAEKKLDWDNYPPILDGDDFGVGGIGYAPSIVVALAKLAGIGVDSI